MGDQSGGTYCFWFCAVVIKTTMAELVMLMSHQTNAGNVATTEAVRVICKSRKIAFTEIIGEDDVDLRTKLFDISYQAGTYPQLFKKEGDEYTFIGVGEDIKSAEDMQKMIKELKADKDMAVNLQNAE